jgi:hypothetical protein
LFAIAPLALPSSSPRFPPISSRFVFQSCVTAAENATAPMYMHKEQ